MFFIFLYDVVAIGTRTKISLGAGHAVAGLVAVEFAWPEFLAIRGVGDGLDGAGVDDLVTAGRVLRGDLEAVEEQAGAFGIELAGGDGVDDQGERDLNRTAIFKRQEGDWFDLPRRIFEGGAGTGGLGVDGYESVRSSGLRPGLEAIRETLEAAVEVAVIGVADGGGVAFFPAGLDVAAFEVDDNYALNTERPIESL